MEPRLSVLTLAVADLGRAVRFYRDGLGLATDGIVGTEFELGAVAFFAMNEGLALALYPAASLAREAGVAVPLPQPPGGVAIGHNVGSAAEVDALLGRAEAAGATITDPGRARFWGGHAGYFHDPDGHLWEIAWNPAWPG